MKWSDLTGKARPNEPWLNGLPRHIFVNDLSDGFCPDVDPWQWLAPSIPSMHLSPHIWLLLTKWPDRMNEFFWQWLGPMPRNFYLGTSIENQAAADERILYLLQTPAAVHYVSVEPCLSAIDLTPWLRERGGGSFPIGLPRRQPHLPANWHQPALQWVVVGGESGPGARPMHPDWARSLRDQCQAAGVPFFFKQWGAYRPHDGHGPAPTRFSDGMGMVCVGKKAAGHLLDGRAWQEFPQRDIE